MNQHTPAQIKAIQTWTEQRDALLREIGLYTTECDNRKKEADAQALRLSDLHKSIAEAEGRIAVLNSLEERHKISVSIEVSELEARKSRLEAECVAEESELNLTKREHGEIIAANLALKDAQATMRDQASVVASVTGEIIETSKTHLSNAKVIMLEIKAIADEVMAKGTENIKTSQIVIDKMPKFIFDMQKPIPIRRTYPRKHPNAPLSVETDEVKS